MTKLVSRPRTKTVYDVAIWGEDFGKLMWRGYRLMWLLSADERHLFHRSAGIKQAREYIARASGVDKEHVIITRSKKE